MQEGQPVAYGSRSLTGTQKRCALIEKELLAIVYGMRVKKSNSICMKNKYRWGLTINHFSQTAEDADEVAGF